MLKEVKSENKQKDKEKEELQQKETKVLKFSTRKGKWEEILSELGRKIDNDKIPNAIIVWGEDYEDGEQLLHMDFFGDELLRCSGLIGLCEWAKVKILEYMYNNE